MKKQFLNQFVNFIWTALCFSPVLYFWLLEGLEVWFYIFLAISFLSVFVPSRLFHLSGKPEFYEKLGARKIRKFVQNGDLVNRIVKINRQSESFIKNKNYAERYLKTVVMYEKYHFICFIFFFMSGILAAWDMNIIDSILIFTSNILYNICPIILQQYNRARILKLGK